MNRQHEQQRAENRQDAGEQLCKAHEQTVRELIDVGDHAADRNAGRLPVEVGEGKLLDAADCPVPDVLDNLICDFIVRHTHDPLCKCGDADGAVSGACHSTGNTIRPALQLLKMKPGISSVSGFFLLDVPNCDLGEHGLFIFADCAVNTDVDSNKLAEIAKLSAESFEQFIGAPAKVAMLSYSSYGSAKHDDVTKVAEAVKIAKEKYPDLVVDGELQLDAALVEEVGQLKAPGSPVAGHANTLVFPSLEAGNIGYKLVQRLAKAPAYGSVLQGLALPVNDLSRGCNADDIVGTVAITAVQAQAAQA